MSAAPPRPYGYGQQLPLDVERATAALAKAGDRRAIDRLVRAHLHHADKLSSFLAGRTGSDPDELRSQAYLGILEALRRYEPDRGLRFLTYAVHWMRAMMTHFLVRSRSVVKPPTKRLHKGKWTVADGRLDAPHGESEETWLETLVSGAEGPEEALLRQEQRAQTKVRASRLLGCLDPRERAVVGMRLMTETEDVPTLKEIGGDGMGISRERVRQLEARAIQKMRAIRGAVGRE